MLMANARDNNNMSASTGSEFADSGYGSMEGSPAQETLSIRSRGKLFRRTTIVHPFEDIEIPQSTINRFLDLQLLFNETLHQHLIKNGKHIGDISIKLKVLGETREVAKPCVIIQCNASLKRKIRHFYDQPHVKSQYQPSGSDLDNQPNLEVYVFSHPPRRIMLDLARDVYLADHHYQRHIAWNSLSGALIEVKGASGMRRASLGGVVCVRNGNYPGLEQFYGMTVGHVFDAPSTEDGTDSVLEMSSSLGSDDGEEDGDGDSEASFSVDISLEDDNYADDLKLSVPKSQDPPGEVLDTKVDENWDWSILANTVKVSENLDWALVSLCEAFSTLPFPRLPNTRQLRLHFDDNTSVRNFPGNGKTVKAMTMNADFPSYGCFKSISFLSLEGGPGFSRVYDLKFDNGLCKSIVVSRKQTQPLIFPYIRPPSRPMRMLDRRYT